MAQTENFTWSQGEDLTVELIYKEGDTAETAVPLDLSANYAVRMDIVAAGTGTRVFTFNSADIPDVDLDQTGEQPDTNKEAALTAGADGSPNISITVPRSLTLPGGPIYAMMTAQPSNAVFSYDLFLRNTATDKQAKILQGSITVEASQTLWL